MQRFQKSDKPDIPVWQLYFRRDWKVSAMGEARPVGGELHLKRLVICLDDGLHFLLKQVAITATAEARMHNQANQSPYCV
jgi:hypothetical protein